MDKLNPVAAIILSICSIGLLTACGSNIDIQGNIHTSDLNEAQKRVPFQIIIPTYLPADVDNKPEIIVPASATQNETKVEIIYNGKNNTVIQIFQSNVLYSQLDPSLNPQITVLNVDNVEVHAEPANMLVPNLSGFNFNWNQGNKHYQVVIFGFVFVEGTNVIKSIINQTR
jgi:hypothetical protein